VTGSCKYGDEPAGSSATELVTYLVNSLQQICKDRQVKYFWTAVWVRAIALTIEEARTSKTSVDFHKTTRRHMLESCHLHTHPRKNPKSEYFWARLQCDICILVTPAAISFCLKTDL
jgi:hypothetical protein